MKSKYLEVFQRVTQQDLPINGGRMLIELLKQEEAKSAGGLYLSTGMKDSLQAPTLGIVLALGNGYEDDDGNLVPVDQLVGSVVLVPDAGIRAYSSFPGLEGYTGGDIALAREADVVASWPSLSHFEAYSKKLNNKA